MPSHGDIAVDYVTAADLEHSPSKTLTRSLRLNTVISTPSSFARQAATAPAEQQQVYQIGKSLQGAVFEQVGYTLAFKKEHSGNKILPSNLRNEYRLHSAVSAAFARYDPMIHSHVRVPKPVQYISDRPSPPARVDPFLGILPQIPAMYWARGNVVRMERILPLPKVVRRAMVTQFYAHDSEVCLGRADGPLPPFTRS